MVSGLIQFVQQFPRQVWLEIMVLGELTDTPAAVTRIADRVSRIKPVRVQLNTVCRPPAEKYARSISIEKMQTLRVLFAEPVDIIGENTAAQVPLATVCTVEEREVVAMLGRRPCAAEDVGAGLRMNVNQAIKKLEQLVAAGLVHRHEENRMIFYTAREPSRPMSEGSPN